MEFSDVNYSIWVADHKAFATSTSKYDFNLDYANLSYYFWSPKMGGGEMG